MLGALCNIQVIPTYLHTQEISVRKYPNSKSSVIKHINTLKTDNRIL